MHTDPPMLASVLLCLSLAAVGCGDGQQRLNCDDLAPPADASFSALYELVSTPSAKSCTSCHNSDSPVFNYSFDGRGAAYDALSSKPELIYAQVAAGGMPKQGEPWGDNELRLFRTWYCNGAFYEDP